MNDGNILYDKVRGRGGRRPSARYARFYRAYEKSSEKKVQVMFHGTSAAAAVDICRKGMDPKLRLSGGDWFTYDPNYALSRAISREEYSVKNLLGPLVTAFPTTSTKTELAIPTRGGGGGKGRAAGSGATGGGGGGGRGVGGDDGGEVARSVRMVAAAVLMDDTSSIGDHIVSKNHHHALPLFVLDFKRRQTPSSVSPLSTT